MYIIYILYSVPYFRISCSFLTYIVQRVSSYPSLSYCISVSYMPVIHQQTSHISKPTSVGGRLYTPCEKPRQALPAYTQRHFWHAKHAISSPQAFPTRDRTYPVFFLFTFFISPSASSPLLTTCSSSPALVSLGLQPVWAVHDSS